MEAKEKDFQHEYMMLGRLQADCKYYLGYGNRHAKHLWAKDEQEQINEMIRLYNLVPEKPEWLTMDEIQSYRKQMTFMPLSKLMGKMFKMVDNLENQSKYSNRDLLIDFCTLQREAEKDTPCRLYWSLHTNGSFLNLSYYEFKQMYENYKRSITAVYLIETDNVNGWTLNKVNDIKKIELIRSI